MYAWCEVLEKAPLPGRDDLGALRVSTIATKDRACAEFPDRTATAKLIRRWCSTSTTGP